MLENFNYLCFCNFKGIFRMLFHFHDKVSIKILLKYIKQTKQQQNRPLITYLQVIHKFIGCFTFIFFVRVGEREVG